jgi:ABC-type transporter Mla subunit MlaD
MSGNIDATLVNLRATSSTLNSTLAQNQRAIQGIATNLNTLSASMNDPQTGVRPLLGKFNSFADTLSQMQLAQTVERTNRSIDKPQQDAHADQPGPGVAGQTHQKRLPLQ